MAGSAGILAAALVIAVALFFFYWHEYSPERLRMPASADFIAYIREWAPRLRSRFVDGKSLYDICQNKHHSRQLARALGIATPRLYFHGFLRDLDPATLPPAFVVKTVRGASSEGVFPFSEEGVNLFQPGNDLASVLARYGDRECIVEEFLKNKSGNTPTTPPPDYKVLCFDGTPEVVLRMRVTGHRRKKKKYFTTKWRPIPLLREGDEDGPGRKPAQLSQLLRAARALGQFFRDNVMRIDFYIVDGVVFFGEFTPHPGGGQGYTRFGKSYLDKLMKKHGLKAGRQK